MDSSGGENNGLLGPSGGVGVSGFPDVTIGQSIIAGNIGRSDDFGGGTIDTDLGNNLLGGDPKLAPLGDYGGPTQTMIPLPGSPAINNAPDSTRSTDQRGFPIIDGSPDIGAAEFQGDSDFQLAIPNIFDIDQDGDGNTFGVEFALGTDPFTPDASNPANLRFNLQPDGDAELNHGYNPDAVGIARWILERSPDLKTWTEIENSTDPGSAVTLTDTPPSNIRTFYRFRAELTE